MPDTLYSPELAESICKHIAEGASLRAICRDPGMPTEGAVRAWARSNQDFGAQYRIARELQLDYWADEIITIADQEESDPRNRQVRIESRKWILSKAQPRRWGDRLLVAGETENPLRVLHEQVSVEKLSSDQLSALRLSRRRCCRHE